MFIIIIVSLNTFSIAAKLISEINVQYDYLTIMALFGPAGPTISPKKYKGKMAGSCIACPNPIWWAYIKSTIFAKS